MAHAFPVAVPSPAFKSILVAADFSPCSESALSCACAIAKRYESTIHLLHVTRTNLSPRELASAQEKFATTERSFKLQTIPHHTHLATGCVREVLLDWSASVGADLIVMGTHGRAGIKHFVVGSIAESVIRSAKCPVLTVGPAVLKRGLMAGSLATMLVAMDDESPPSARLNCAILMARDNTSKLILFHAVEISTKLNAQHLDRADKLVASTRSQLLRLLPADHNDYEVRVYCGPATDMILRVAEDTSADLIVMGAHQPSLASGHAPSSVAHQIICRSPCPVMTIAG